MHLSEIQPGAQVTIAANGALRQLYITGMKDGAVSFSKSASSKRGGWWLPVAFVLQNGKLIAAPRKRTTVEHEKSPDEEPSPGELSRVMSALGRRGGKVGGNARAAVLSPDRRREIAQQAAQKRWGPPQSSAEGDGLDKASTTCPRPAR